MHTENYFAQSFAGASVFCLKLCSLRNHTVNSGPYCNTSQLRLEYYTVSRRKNVSSAIREVPLDGTYNKKKQFCVLHFSTVWYQWLYAHNVTLSKHENYIDVRKVSLTKAGLLHNCVNIDLRRHHRCWLAVTNFSHPAVTSVLTLIQYMSQLIISGRFLIRGQFKLDIIFESLCHK